jgi:hypothetical protein
MTLVGASLSLTGRYARFGTMAAAGLKAWAALRPDVALIIEDDRGEREQVRAGLVRLAARSDVLLGPYSALLTREAGALAAEEGLLVWNHGGAGDDVQTMAPGHLASVLTPAGLYAAPLVDWLARQPDRSPLALLSGRGRFGRQVVAGAQTAAGRLGLPAIVLPAKTPEGLPERWDLLCAGSFEEDLAAVLWARNLRRPPRCICTVAAGIREFGRAIGDPAGMLGLAQWLPGAAGPPSLGPAEAKFLAAHEGVAGAAPDYPAVQAAAAAELAVHCREVAGSAEPASIWRVASQLRATTFFGAFAIDAASGLQTAHRTTVVRWTDRGSNRLEPGAAPLL